MLTKSEAMELVSKELRKMSTSDEPFVVVDADTIDKPFGWIFFYNSKKYLETGAFSFRLAGNGPVIVNKQNGAIEFFGSGKPPLEIVAEYEQKFAGGNTR